MCRPEVPGGHASGQPEGWLFLHPDAIPERWRERAVPAALVPLLPGEAAAVLTGRPAEPVLEGIDRVLGHLIAEGLTVDAAARQVDMSLRGVQRRLARLRDRFGVASTSELRSLLARRGF